MGQLHVSQDYDGTRERGTRKLDVLAKKGNPRVWQRVNCGVRANLSANYCR